ncbi:MAG: hydrogen gas-evolving membrane-bound hydrogenase subunit E [Ilumatobacteraceae bacterium]
MMLFVAIFAQFAVGGLTLVGLRRRPALAAALGVVVLACSAVLVAARGIGGAETSSYSVRWLPILGFNLNVQLDGFAVVMALLVSVLGAAVLVYSLAYFEHDGTYARFVGLFMAFAGSMFGLVLAEDLFTMFVFWELTSVWSFLLIGLNDKSTSARQAAVRALLTTGAGGLCLLAGVGILQVQYGTTSFSELLAAGPSGNFAHAAAILLLLGAFTKSAQFPFHFWLPGAMAAPTPVSAYLHSATMVKAGIVLLARTSPIFADVGVWRWWVVVAGVVTMVLGGWRALREVDAKLVLAYSTVSQLGLLTVLFGVGNRYATYAGVAHIVAHAIFKVGLFLGVGVIDHEIGTRDVSKIGAARRAMPTTTLAMVLSLLSMAGIIPLLGFATKEKALVALLDLERDAVGVVALAGVVVGSVLSVAYSIRLLRAVLRSDVAPERSQVAAHSSVDADHHSSVAVRIALSGPVVVAAAVSLAAGLTAATVGSWLVAPSKSLDVNAVSKLALWPGINDALITSAIVIAVGAVIGWRAPLAQSATSAATGERVFDGLYDTTMRLAKRITAVTQSGSLPIYVGVTLLVAAGGLVAGLVIDAPRLTGGVSWGSPLEALVSIVAMVLAVGVAVARPRFAGALFLGGVGYAIAVLFAMRGAPDLATTQLLVETLTIVVFLLALRSMTQKPGTHVGWTPRVLRLGIAVGVGIVVPLFLLAARASRIRPSPAQEYFARSLDEAGGRNVVNVILVDFRGFDTMGEIVVLAVAALGVVNLVRRAAR